MVIAAHPEVTAEADELAAGADDDVAERIRLAAQSAAQRAEERAIDEILALEQDLERAKDEAAGELESIEGRLSEAERRASEAERRAEEAERRAEEAADELSEARARAGGERGRG